MSLLNLFRRRRADEVGVTWGPCCFCGTEIDPSRIDPCRVSVTTTSGKWQVWVCHAACFKERITTGVEVDLSPAHF